MNYLLIAISFIALIHVSLTLRRAYLRAMEIYHDGMDALKRDEDFDPEILDDYELLPEDSKLIYNIFIRYGSICIFAFIRVPIFMVIAYLLIQFIKLQW